MLVDTEYDFGKETERITELCKQYNVALDRVHKCFLYLKSNNDYKGQSDTALADYLECQIKMLYYGAIKNLIGE